MGLHQKHSHGRVYHGLEARDQLAERKRDSHGDEIKMHVPDGFDQKDSSQNQGSQNEDVQTAVNVVYVTLSQTFSGPAVYSTIGATPTSASDSNANPTSSVDAGEASYLAAKSSAQAGAVSSSTAIVSPQSSDASPMTTMATSTSALAAAGISSTAATYANGRVAGSPLAATRSPVADEQSQNSGMTGGAKAGLAIGMLALVALAAGLIFFCWRRKQSAKAREQLMDEKHGSFADAGARRVEAGGKRDSSMTEKVPASLRSTRTASTAPRLSLRPVTQFLPNLAVQPRTSPEKPQSAWERSPSQNPFADTDATMMSEKQARPDSPPSNPFDEPEGKKSSDSQGSAGATTAVGAASLAGNDLATPKSTKFGTASAVPVAAAGAAKDVGPRGPNNVHRVQLDFKPSMDDELELRSGQLVRMLHEYDDGWALCIRMDRSQQGVAPRTCLSKLPVKPRPQGPPGQGSRPGTPQGPPRSSPNGAPNGSFVPRPLTPTQSSRAQSPTDTNGDASTAPASVPARKPVPGQAM